MIPDARSGRMTGEKPGAPLFHKRPALLFPSSRPELVTTLLAQVGVILSGALSAGKRNTLRDDNRDLAFKSEFQRKEILIPLIKNGSGIL